MGGPSPDLYCSKCDIFYVGYPDERDKNGEHQHLKERTMDTDLIMQYFEYEHLRSEGMKRVSKMFHDVAWNIHNTIPACEERAVSLRKLLEGKDAAVRAAMEKK